jgi:predicted unusual protein kinase regulating ubiquinone biosynthesis (AarF/ABC1/UbiB family)
MALIPGINTTISRNISLAELGLRGSFRVAQTIARVSPRAWRWGLRRKRPPARELRELFEALGATYIKFGQFIASSPSLFPKEYVDEFQQLLDQTAPIPFRTIAKTIEQDLGKPLSEIYRSIDPEPLASASIAQVHAATLLTGEDVVVKVQKPGVQAIITVDLHSVFVMVRLLEYMLPNTDRDALTGVVAEMYQAMIDECDFIKEARYLDGFREFLATTGVQSVVAPRAYHQASSARVLTMERFYGCALTDKKALDRLNLDPAASLFEALNVWFASLMGCDFFHADLHSGNMLLLEDGRVGFIDFGMVGRVSPESWQAVFGLFTGLSEENYRMVAESMLAVGMTREDISVAHLTRDIEQVFRAINEVDPEEVVFGRDKLSGTDSVNKVINSLGEVARNHGIRFPRSFTLLLKQFLYFDRYIQILAPGANLFDDDRVIMGLHP